MTREEQIEVLKIELAEADRRVQQAEDDYDDETGDVRELNQAVLAQGRTLRALHNLGWAR